MAGRVEQASPFPAPDDTLSEIGAGDALPILLVDDHPENLSTLEAVLAPLGYPIKRASSGEEALRLLLEYEFALILLDVRMPGLDGLETARLIKGRARTKDVPIVFLTAARDELGDMIRGYGVGAVDYVLKPVDPELLRSKVAVFAELEASRRALKRSEAFLRAAFEAAPIGKTMLDSDGRIVRSNPAFARLVGHEAAALQGVPVSSLLVEEDRATLLDALERVSHGDPDAAVADVTGIDLRLTGAAGAEVWVGLVASTIERHELSEPMALVQWVDLSARRRAERARGELLVEQAARTQAEAIAERLRRLQGFSGAIELLSLEQLLPEIALRLAELFDADTAEVRIREDGEEPVVVRAGARMQSSVSQNDDGSGSLQWQEVPLRIEGQRVGGLRLGLAEGKTLSAPERSLLYDVADRAALSIQRAELHEQEHRIAVELQRGLLPKQLPELDGVELAAHYQAAGLGAEAGGDWYDAFALPGGRLGVVVGDVAGNGIQAASAMGQLRSVTRAFALADEGAHKPGQVLTFLNRHQLALGQDELFTVVYAIIDPVSGTVSWANAGHPPTLLRRGSGETSFLEGGEGLTGIEELVYEDQELRVTAGDTLILYTDGLVERRGESLDDGLRRLEDAVLSGPAESEPLCHHVLRAVLPPESELRDDVTAVVARIA